MRGERSEAVEVNTSITCEGRYDRRQYFAEHEPILRDTGVEMIKEFRDFLMRGNLVELAVAFVMGLAFAALAVVSGLLPVCRARAVVLSH